MFGATVFSTFSPQATAQAFGFAIDLGLKALVLCAAALALDRVLGRRLLARSAALNACLLGLVLLPAAALVSPQWKLNFAGEQAPAESSPFALRKDVVSRSETRRNAEMRPAETSLADSPAQVEAAAPVLAPALELSPFAPRKDSVSRSETRQNAAMAPVARSINWRAVVLLIYAAVSLGALLRLSRSLAAVARLKRSGAPLPEPAWNDRLAHWRARLGVARPVQLRLTDRVDVPVVVGWRRPAILAPQPLAEADRKTIDAILLHELAHVHRADYGWNLLLKLVQALYWPNPLLWLVGRAMGRVREQACDELCIHWLGGAETYRATLLELASGLLRRPLAALGMAMAGASRLQRRLEQIDASRGRAECQSRLCWRFATLAVVASLAGALGALKITSRAAAEPPAPAHVKIDKSKVQVDGKKAAAAVEKEDATGTKAPESSAPGNPAAGSKEEKARQPDKPGPSNAAKEGAGKTVADEPAEPIKVRVEKVRREDFIVQTSQPGTLKPSRSMELYARVAGLIVARHAGVGDHVKAGQVLAEIDAPELDAELEQANALAEEGPAAVEQAQGKLDEALAGLEGATAEVAKSEADLKQATSQLAIAEKVYKRAVELRARKAIDSQTVDEKESQFKAAQGAVNVAQAQVAAARAAVRQAEAAVAVAKAGLRLAQLRLAAAQQTLKRVEQRADFRQIKAPFDGVVVRQAAEPGSLAKISGVPLFEIAVTGRLTMETQIPESDALRVQPGQRAQVWLDAERNGKPHDAQVSRVGYALDPETRTMSVEIDLDNSDGRLRPGMYGRVTIDLETHPGVLTLRRMSVFTDGTAGDGRVYSFRVVDGRAVKTAVVPGERNGTRQVINSGLKEGDVVIAVLERGLEDGVRVEIVDVYK